jgi:hypothetical protein
VSFWGYDSTNPNLEGGCCSSSTSTDELHTEGYGQSFTLSYGAIDLPPPPPNTALTLVANVSGTTQADDAYWNTTCGAIPDTALYVRLVMGTVSEAPLQLVGVARFVPVCIDLACYVSVPTCASRRFATRAHSFSCTVESILFPPLLLLFWVIRWWTTSSRWTVQVGATC